MERATVEVRSTRLREELITLQAQVATPDAISRKQVVEALEALQSSLEELEAAEHELAQQNEELMAAREAVEIERHRFRELFELAPFAYIVTDLQGRVEEANQAAHELWGASRIAMSGKPLAMLVSAEERNDFRSLLRQLREEGGALDVEIDIAPYNHAPRRTVAVTAQRDEDKPGGRVRLRWTMRDISDRKAAEEALRLSEERLRHSQKLEAVGRLAGGIAHSFNNLLAGIAFHSELLLDARCSDADRRRHAEAIQGAGERAALLSRQLLAFSRKQVLEPGPLDVNARLEAMAPLLRRLIGEHIDLVTELAPDAGWIHADLGQLEQVILNLVVNARDAMPHGGRLLLATAGLEVEKDLDAPGSPPGAPGLAPGRYLRITVSDTGTGMTEEVQAHLFEPFFTTKERERGSGLGLPTVYGIVRQSGGEVRVASELGKGTTFDLFLPSIPAPAHLPERAGAAGQDTRGSEVVLLVEDEDNIREPVQEVLEGQGYTVLAASHGAEALATARDCPGGIDLLITDVVMPGMSGRELAEALGEERADTRVLYISGYPEDAIAHHGVLHAGRWFLQKPFPPGLLLRKVREILETPEEKPE